MLFSTFVNEVGVKRRCWCSPTWKLMLFSTFVNEVGVKRRWGWCWRCCSNAGEKSGERLKVFLTFSTNEGYYCLNNSSQLFKIHNFYNISVIYMYFNTSITLLIIFYQMGSEFFIFAGRWLTVKSEKLSCNLVRVL